MSISSSMALWFFTARRSKVERICLIDSSGSRDWVSLVSAACWIASSTTSAFLLSRAMILASYSAFMTASAFFASNGISSTGGSSAGGSSTGGTGGFSSAFSCTSPVGWNTDSLSRIYCFTSSRFSGALSLSSAANLFTVSVTTSSTDALLIPLSLAINSTALSRSPTSARKLYRFLKHFRIHSFILLTLLPVYVADAAILCSTRPPAAASDTQVSSMIFPKSVGFSTNRPLISSLWAL